MVKYPFWVQKLLHYTIQDEGGNKCLYLRGRLRLTPARQLSAYMSSRVLATTTASVCILFYSILTFHSWHKLKSPNKPTCERNKSHSVINFTLSYTYDTWLSLSGERELCLALQISPVMENIVSTGTDDAELQASPDTVVLLDSVLGIRTRTVARSEEHHCHLLWWQEMLKTKQPRKLKQCYRYVN